MNAQDTLEELTRKVWITRKSRIEASERVRNKYNLYKGLQVYYSIFIVVYSIWNIQPNSSNDRISEASLFLLIISIIFSIFSMYVSTKNLQEKYFNFKTNYVELEKIYGQLRELNSTNEIQQIRNQYVNLLSAVDNHETIDYYRVILRDPDERNNLGDERIIEIEKFIKREEKKYICYKIFLYLMPILLPLLIKVFMTVINYIYPID